jgi:cell division protein FtsL
MNAAARLVHQEAVTRHLIYVQFLTRKLLGTMLLGLTVLISSLSVIYVTHLTRELHANYGQNLAESNRLRIERDQLLLERSTSMVQTRIEQTAETRLGMEYPGRKSIVVVNE